MVLVAQTAIRFLTLPIPKPNYLPHSWTHLTYLSKLRPYVISRFATMHWTDRCTAQQLDGMFDDYKPLSLYREERRRCLKCDILVSVNYSVLRFGG